VVNSVWTIDRLHSEFFKNLGNSVCGHFFPHQQSTVNDSVSTR